MGANFTLIDPGIGPVQGGGGRCEDFYGLDSMAFLAKDNWKTTHIDVGPFCGPDDQWQWIRHCHKNVPIDEYASLVNH